MKHSSKTTGPNPKTLDRLRSLPDSEIDTSDIPELDEDFFARARLVLPTRKQAVSIRLDADVVEWFRHQGRGYQTRINRVLRVFVEHEKKAAGE